MVGEWISGEGSGGRDERRETKILLEGERGFGYFGGVGGAREPGRVGGLRIVLRGQDGGRRFR